MKASKPNPAPAATTASDSGKPVRQKPNRLEERWKSAYLGVKTLQVAQILWETVLTDREKELLGGEAAVVQLGARAMWQKVRRGTDRQAVIAVAIAVQLITAADGKAILARSGESFADAEGDRAQAIADGGLVIDGSLRQVHWKTVLVPINWSRHEAAWEFLFDLAQRATSGASLDSATFSVAPETGRTNLRSIKSRLVNLEGFPAMLANCIRPAGRGTYLLELPKGNVRVFTMKNYDALVELGPEE